MSTTTSYPIVLGSTFGKEEKDKKSGPSFVSVKYNFVPPSIVQSNPGYLRCNNGSDTQWLLEYDMRQREEDRRGSRSSAQGFQGTQTASKEFDCVLVWNEKTQSYVLDRLSSTFSFKYDRGHSKLSETAIEGLRENSSPSRHASDVLEPSALGLELSGFRSKAALSDGEAVAGQEKGEGDDDDEEEFARQLELGLEGSTTDEQGKDSSMEERYSASPPRAKTGLGLMEANGLRDDVITPRGSPYIDRPRGTQAKSTLGQSRAITSKDLANNVARSTPVVSPNSVTNSPRPAGLDSTLSASNSWKPPPQRSSVAIAYDEDEEEGDEESEDYEEEDEEDEDDDDDDLDDYARQLESSLQG